LAPAIVTVYGTLNRFIPGAPSTVSTHIDHPCSAGELLARIGVPTGMLSMLVLNGKRVDLEAGLSPGDRLEAFPYCGGG
jgi:hypothetical protein